MRKLELIRAYQHLRLELHESCKFIQHLLTRWQINASTLTRRVGIPSLYSNRTCCFIGLSCLSLAWRSNMNNALLWNRVIAISWYIWVSASMTTKIEQRSPPTYVDTQIQQQANNNSDTYRNRAIARKQPNISSMACQREWWLRMCEKLFR